jgi:hypothetical protein
MAKALQGPNRPYMVRARKRIEGTQALTKLIDYVAADPTGDNGPKPGDLMTHKQVDVCLALVKKVVPDLSSQTLHVTDEKTSARELTLAEINMRLERLRQPGPGETIQ